MAEIGAACEKSSGRLHFVVDVLPVRSIRHDHWDERFGLGSIYVAADEATSRLEWDGDILLEDVWERGSVHLLDIANGIRHCATQSPRFVCVEKERKSKSEQLQLPRSISDNLFFSFYLYFALIRVTSTRGLASGPLRDSGHDFHYCS